ncbi:hypothetical protein [Anabaena sp. CCY 9402-a]|uniref:hypothetical protein n=1 Tax=Anabaena sp. CCY 9402-a TaxID=3103867 RepID=UPI0039C5C1B9
MRQLQQLDPVLEELFTQIQPDIKETLTTEQVTAIKKAFGSNTWTRWHPLDLRMTLPIPGLRFYMVLLGGEEQRSKQRLQYAKVLYPLWTPSNIIFLFVFFIILSVCSFATFSSLLSTFSSISNANFSPSPTSIPWIFDKSECEHTSRTWENGKCWDSEHNPMF